MDTSLILQTIDEGVVRVTEQGHRNHLGASIIGKSCSRQLWYTFYWAKAQKFEARMLRLFERGHKEEFVFEKLLKDIGCQVWTVDENREQFRCVDCNGHFGGSLDGVAKGIPTIPDHAACLTEFKTHNDKSFKKLKKDGLVNSKFEHYAQIQVYLYKFGLQYCLYMAVNKNDDDIHLEIVLANPAVGIEHIERGRDIIFSPTPPAKISESPSWWACKFCHLHGICHGDELAEVNCRTCIHSQPVDDGKWVCQHPVYVPVNTIGPEINKSLMKVGCSEHEYKECFKK